MTLLRWAVVVSGLASLAALTVRLRSAWAFGRPIDSSAPKGRSAEGVGYALGRGLLPWEKESARRHWMVYGAGILYHAGIFCALALLAAETIVIPLPEFAVRVLRLGLAVGAAAGVGILVKRAVRPLSRALSRTEDYAANILVDLFLLAGWAATLTRTATAPFLGISILLFAYIPFGKIRHCLFFFSSRIFFGALFGRRGVLPPASKAC